MQWHAVIITTMIVVMRVVNSPRIAPERSLYLVCLVPPYSCSEASSMLLYQVTATPMMKAIMPPGHVNMAKAQGSGAYAAGVAMVVAR